MKICILSHTLNTNYGGLLQAYALQKVLRDMGHDAVTAKYAAEEKMSICARIIKFGYHFIKQYIFRSKSQNPFRYLFISISGYNKINSSLSVNTERFIKNNIRTIDFFEGNLYPSAQMISQFDALIVGSDQVWRPTYVYAPAYFLDFSKGIDIKRMAYAASFGLESTAEFKPEVLAKCKEGAKLFDAISVREDDAVEICKEEFGVNAVHLLDSTMLLDKEDYLALIEPCDKEKKQNILMCYVLDKTEEKCAIIDAVSQKLGLTPIYVMPSKDYYLDKYNDISECVFPAVSTWIAGFRDAEFVLTDSFHGTVFAIIFNKPFISINNKLRGSSRFNSVLKEFNLQNRLISKSSDLTDELLEPIDYLPINQIREDYKKKAMAFLEILNH